MVCIHIHSQQIQIDFNFILCFISILFLTCFFAVRLYVYSQFFKTDECWKSLSLSRLKIHSSPSIIQKVFFIKINSRNEKKCNKIRKPKRKVYSLHRFRERSVSCRSHVSYALEFRQRRKLFCSLLDVERVRRKQ